MEKVERNSKKGDISPLLLGVGSLVYRKVLVIGEYEVKQTLKYFLMDRITLK